MTEALATIADRNHFEDIERNPFNVNPTYQFNPAPDYQHDIKLLASQLGSVQEVEVTLGDNDIHGRRPHP